MPMPMYLIAQPKHRANVRPDSRPDVHRPRHLIRSLTGQGQHKRPTVSLVKV